MSPRRRIVLTVAVATLVPAWLDAVGVAVQARLAGEAISGRAVFWQACEWLIFGALTPLAFWASRRFPLRWPVAWRHLAWHGASALGLCVAWATLGIALRWGLGLDPLGDDAHVQWLAWMANSIPWAVFMYFSVAGSVHAFALWQQSQASQRAAAELAAELAGARLEALQRQLHPHFLFNALNAITVLVRDGETTAAAGMLERLSHLLRSVLRSDGSPLLPLGADLRLALDYLEIERQRFPDRLVVAASVPEVLLALPVPVLLLQPLVENAVRHGIAPHERRGEVRIEGMRDGAQLVLRVLDDGPPWRTSGDGVGLRNTAERLAALYGATARCELAREGAWTVASVRLPWPEVAP